jgi:hypothetical protein
MHHDLRAHALDSPRLTPPPTPPTCLPALPHAPGGLTEADFIVAAKINSLDVSSLLPKRKARYWA